jgi:hypothetical protein
MEVALMLNEIKNGLVTKLNEVFGSAITVYTEGIEQDFLKPCFFLLFLNPRQKQLVGKRYFRNQPLDIRYYPSTANKNEEMYDVADRLYDVLEYISTSSSTLRGSNISHEIIDGVLHVHVEFNMFVIKTAEPEELMGNVQVETHA